MTTGYEPHQVLWHLFHVSGQHARPLTEAERKGIVGIVTNVTEHRMHPEGSSLVGRFMRLMEEKNGKRLSIEDADLADGLLTCLDPYQGYEPRTNPDALQFKLGGIFDHFKGGVYLIRDFSSWASGNGEPVVEYLSMIFGTKHTRLVSEWCEVVKWPDGKYRSRFVYRGPDLKSPAPSFKVPSPS